MGRTMAYNSEKVSENLRRVNKFASFLKVYDIEKSRYGKKIIWFANVLVFQGESRYPLHAEVHRDLSQNGSIFGKRKGIALEYFEIKIQLGGLPRDGRYCFAGGPFHDLQQASVTGVVKKQRQQPTAPARRRQERQGGDDRQCRCDALAGDFHLSCLPNITFYYFFTTFSRDSSWGRWAPWCRRAPPGSPAFFPPPGTAPFRSRTPLPES